MPRKKAASKKKIKNVKEKSSLKDVEEKLNQILKYEKEQNKSDDVVEEIGKKQLKRDVKFEKEIDQLQKDLEKEVGSHPLRKITYRDFGKALIGAFIGVVSHFAFLEGAVLSEKLSIFRATMILITGYVLGIIFIYVAGFRKVKQINVLKFVPLRITVIYIVSLFVVYFVLFLFGLTEHSTGVEIYKQVAAVSIPAIIGASAADLIGKNE